MWATFFTVSIGVATIFPHLLDDKEALFLATERAMYAAKEGGRNQVQATFADGTALQALQAIVMR